MATTKTQIASLYRRLLRELPVRAPSSQPASRTSHQKLSSPTFLQTRFRQLLSSEHANGKSQLEQAEEFVKYVQAQRMYSTLVERYNPGMSMSEEERVRLTARKVGMDLPPEFISKK